MREILEAAKQVLAGKSKQLNESVMSEIDLTISTVFEEGGDQAAAVDELINQFDLTKEEADQLVRDWLMNTEDDGIEESADESTDLKPGDKIFVGLANKNGTGYSGVLERIEGNKVIFRGIDGRLFQGRLELATKQEDTSEAVESEGQSGDDIQPGDMINIGGKAWQSRMYGPSSGEVVRIEGPNVIFKASDGNLYKGSLDVATKMSPEAAAAAKERARRISAKKANASEAVDPSVKSRMNALASMARKNVEKTKDITRQISGEKGAKNVEHGFRSAIKRDYKRNDRDVQEAAGGEVSLNDASKMLRDAGATNIKTGAESLRFYFNGKPGQIKLSMDDSGFRWAKASDVEAAIRGNTNEALVVGKKSEAWEKGWDAGYSERSSFPSDVPYSKGTQEYKDFMAGAATGYDDYKYEKNESVVVGKKSEAWEKGWDAGYSERTAVPANPYPKDSPEFKEFFRGASTGYDDYQHEKNESVASKGKSVTESKEYSVAQEDGEWVVKDASGNIVDTATDKLGALQAARDLNSMKQSNRRVVTGKQPQADVEEDYHPGKYGNTMDQIVAKIAAVHLGFDTLETQKSDRLDFKEVAVWRAKEALEDAFKAGFEKGQSRAGVKQVGEASKFKVPPMRVKMSTQDAIKYTSEVLGELDPNHQYWPGASFDDVYNAAKAADVPDWQARMLASSMHDVKTKNSEGVKEAYDWPGHTVEVDWGPEEGDEALTAEERQWLQANLPAYQELADTVNDNNIDEHEVVRAMMDAQEVFEHGYLPDGIQGAAKALTRAKDAVYNYFNDDEDGELNYRRKMRSRDRVESVEHFAKFLG